MVIYVDLTNLFYHPKLTQLTGYCILYVGLEFESQKPYFFTFKIRSIHFS